MSEPRRPDDAWFAWERARRLASQLQAVLRQMAALVDQVAEAIEAAEPPTDGGR